MQVHVTDFLPVDRLVRRLAPLLARSACDAQTCSDHGIVLLHEHPFCPPPLVPDHQNIFEYSNSACFAPPVYEIEVVGRHQHSSSAQRLVEFFEQHKQRFPKDFAFAGATFACSFCTGANKVQRSGLHQQHQHQQHQPQQHQHPAILPLSFLTQQTQRQGTQQQQFSQHQHQHQQQQPNYSPEELAALLFPTYLPRHEYLILRGVMDVFDHCQSPAHLAARQRNILDGTCTVLINGTPMALERTLCIYPEQMFGAGAMLYDDAAAGFVAPDCTGAVQLQQGGEYRLARFALRNPKPPQKRGTSASVTDDLIRALPTRLAQSDVQQRQHRRSTKTKGNLATSGDDDDNVDEEEQDSDDEDSDEESNNGSTAASKKKKPFGSYAKRNRQRVERHFAGLSHRRLSVLSDEHPSRRELRVLREQLQVSRSDMPSRANMRALRFEEARKLEQICLKRHRIAATAAESPTGDGSTSGNNRRSSGGHSKKHHRLRSDAAAAASSGPARNLLTTTRLMKVGRLPLQQLPTQCGDDDDGPVSSVPRYVVGRSDIRYSICGFARMRLLKPRVPLSIQAERIKRRVLGVDKWRRRAAVRSAFKDLVKKVRAGKKP